jgi:hypothetical protein
MLLDDPAELTDVIRTVEKIHDNRHRLLAPPALSAH